MYANNQPFTITQRMTIESIKNFTNKNIIIHEHNSETIKKFEWYDLIKDYWSIEPHRPGRRDGSYNAWKPLLCRDIYFQMNEGDILYYIDSSAYFIEGFTENIDKLCDIANKKEMIAGSIGDDVMNNSYKCCDNILVWNKVIPCENNEKNLCKRHILSCWFLVKKCESNNLFMKEWGYYSLYKDDELPLPLVLYHHTVEQSIFNILVLKYKKLIFYDKNIRHDDNKNKNLVLKIINNAENTDDYFIYL
jgi:hypothetical protein